MKPRRVPGTGATALQRRRSRRGAKIDIRIPRDREGTFDPSDPALPAAVSRLRRQDRVDVRARHDGSRDPGPSPGALRAGGVAGPDFDGHRRRARDRGRTGRSRRAIRWFSSTPSGSRLVLGLDPRIRDEGLVRNKAVYVALGVAADGTKDILGLWIETTEGAKFWLKVMNELKACGVEDILIAVAVKLAQTA